jgi:hypothetical protein
LDSLKRLYKSYVSNWGRENPEPFGTLAIYNNNHVNSFMVFSVKKLIRGPCKRGAFFSQFPPHKP